MTNREELIARIYGPCGYIETPLCVMLGTGPVHAILAWALEQQCIKADEKGYWTIDLIELGREYQIPRESIGEVLGRCGKYLRIKQVGSTLEFKAKLNSRRLISDLYKFISSELCNPPKSHE